MMGRRTVFAAISSAGLVAALWPALLLAQPEQMPRVAVLNWSAAEGSDLTAFRQGLREAGFVEGRNVRVDFYFADSQMEKARGHVRQILKQPVSVIVALTTPAAQAVVGSTSTVPIVVATADPLGSGFVSNLSRPGGNITGISNMMPDLEAKRIEFLKELIPGMRRIGYLLSENDPAAKSFHREAVAAAPRFGVEVVAVHVKTLAEIDSAFARLKAEHVQAVIVQPLFVLTTASASKVADLALKSGIISVSGVTQYAVGGGFMSYGPDAGESRRAAALHVARILRGTPAGEIPVEQPTKLQLVINLRTAATLGLQVPQRVIIRADEVIE